MAKGKSPDSATLKAVSKLRFCEHHTKNMELRTQRVMDHARSVVENTQGQVVLVGHGVLFSKMLGRHLKNCEFVKV